jgi:integrase
MCSTDRQLVCRSPHDGPLCYPHYLFRKPNTQKPAKLESAVFGSGSKVTCVWDWRLRKRRAYTLARKEGLLTTRPEFPVITVDNARQGFFERADFEKVRAELQSETAKNVVTFAYLTGWRTRSEILPLTWDRVDFAAGVVRLDVRQSKNGAGRSFPFDAMPELGAVLGRQKLAADAFQAIHGGRPRWVFFHLDVAPGGAPAGSPVRAFDQAWRSACVRAGVSGRILHDFRRTAVRNLVRAAVSESVAMQLCGHKTRKIFDRYSIVSERDLREGVAKLAAQAEREAAAAAE